MNFKNWRGEREEENERGGIKGARGVKRIDSEEEERGMEGWRRREREKGKERGGKGKEGEGYLFAEEDAESARESLEAEEVVTIRRDFDFIRWRLSLSILVNDVVQLNPKVEAKVLELFLWFEEKVTVRKEGRERLRKSNYKVGT